MSSLCKFCGVNPMGPKSHIVPEFLYKHVYEYAPGGARKLLAWDEKLNELTDKKHQNIQKGYREKMLCTKCEGYFSKQFESPTARFFHRLSLRDLRRKKKIKVAAPAKLGHLVLSVLWRASQSVDEAWHGSLRRFDSNLAHACLMKRKFKSSFKIFGWAVVINGKLMNGGIGLPATIIIAGTPMHVVFMGGIQFVVTALDPGKPEPGKGELSTWSTKGLPIHDQVWQPMKVK